MYAVNLGSLKGSWPSAFVARKNVGKFTGGWRLVRIRGPDVPYHILKPVFERFIC